MAQINLLKQKSLGQNWLRLLPSIVAKFLMLVILAMFAYYGWLYTQNKKVNIETGAVEIKIIEAKKQAASIEKRDELLTRQGQLKQLESLIASHVYFSQIFKPLADVTLKTSWYSSLKAFSSGSISLSVVVPNIQELDKFLQVFNSPKFVENFSNVRVSGFKKIQENEQVSYSFEINMDFNANLLQYNNSNKQQ